MARKRSLVVIGTADLGDFAEDQRAGATAKGGAERYQSEIDSAEDLGRDASLESLLSPEVDATVGRLELEF